MKHFIVDFYDGTKVFVDAFYQDEAVVLAQAEMIRRRCEYDAINVRETGYSDDKKLVDFVVGSTY